MQAIRLPLALLGLIAALAGPLLRQAEAADDLARSLSAAGLGSPAEIQPDDPGVGDDPELGTCKASVHASPPPPGWLPPGPECPAPGLRSPHSHPQPTSLARRQRGWSSRPPASARERQAWLQVLLF